MVDPLPLAQEFLCVRCARQSLTCCQTSQIYVSPGDARRISAHLDQPVEQFAEFRYPDDPIYLTAHDDDPIWPLTVIRDDDHRRVLKRQENGDCSFLGDAGCRLPMETRPLVCRLYPYDYNEQGLKPTLASGCPIELLPAGRSLLEELEMNEQDARRWHRMLYEEIREEPHARLPADPVGGSAAPGNALHSPSARALDAGVPCDSRTEAPS